MNIRKFKLVFLASSKNPQSYKTPKPVDVLILRFFVVLEIDDLSVWIVCSGWFGE